MKKRLVKKLNKWYWEAYHHADNPKINRPGWKPKWYVVCSS